MPACNFIPVFFLFLFLLLRCNFLQCSVEPAQSGSDLGLLPVTLGRASPQSAADVEPVAGHDRVVGCGGVATALLRLLASLLDTAARLLVA